MTERRQWRIGELARAAGVSVRTLHHYEAAGVLPPPSRTEAGHRLYGDANVQRLYRIMALRRLGLGLADVARCLESDDGALVLVARRHLEEVERQIAGQTRLRSRLQRILVALERDDEPSVDRFLEAMEAMTMFERYFTPEQLAQLQERHRLMGDAAIKSGETRWAELIQEAEAARLAGVEPTSAELADLWRRWQELIEQFTGGDPGIYQSLKTMYQTEGIAQASRGLISPELMEYVSRGCDASA